MKSLVATLALMLAAGAHAAPLRVTFWHYLGADDQKAEIKRLADDFNRSQTRVQIVPTEVGDYKTLSVKTVAALRAGDLPDMAMVDNAFFTRLAVGGQLQPLDAFTKTLPKATAEDFYPVLWDYGIAGGKRYGLPWAASTLLLYYNSDALKAKGLTPPTTWEDFAKTARALSGRASKGAIFLTDAWQFASFVSSRGGNLITADQRPNFDSADAVNTLQYFYDLTRAGAIIPRGMDEVNFAILDFLRTKAFMVVAPTSVFPLANDYSVGFRPGVTTLPGRTLAGEAQLVVFKNTNEAAARGAYDFWQYLTRPENVAAWVKASGYLPVRKSAVKHLGDAAKSPVIAAGMEALERSFNLPRLVEFNDWRSYLEDALERSLKGGVEPRLALIEAQRLSLAVRAPSAR